MESKQKAALDPSRTPSPSSASFRQFSIDLVIQLKAVSLGHSCRLLPSKADEEEEEEVEGAGYDKVFQTGHEPEEGFF